MRDSYQRFLDKGYITKEQLFEFGMTETIYAPLEKAENAWEELKYRINNNGTVYIRGFGRNSNGSPLFQAFYKGVLENENVEIDKTNNQKPTIMIRNMTGYSKSKNSTYELIRNYQVSHIFGRTKNVYAFTAPWNIVYLPKLIDPLTGHEAKGDMAAEYQSIFQKKSYSYFKPLIEDYNKIMSNNNFRQRVENYLDKISSSNSCSQEDIEKLTKAVAEELSPITIENI